MLDRLVAMCIVSHIHNLHFTDLMDHLSVIAIIKYRRNGKYGIQHRDEFFTSTHQIDQSLRIVEYRPCIMPAISFRESISPFQRRERSHKLAVLILSTHQFGLFIKQVFIVHCTFGIQIQFLFRTSQVFCNLVDAPVIIGIFQRTGGILVNLYIIRHISQFIVIVMPKAASRRNCRMYVFCSVDQTSVQSFEIIHLYTLDVSIH